MTDLPAKVKTAKNVKTLLEGVEQVLGQLQVYSDMTFLNELRAQACALTEYLRGHGELEYKVREARLRVERRIGEVLEQTVRAGNPQLSKDPTIGPPITLEATAKEDVGRRFGLRGF